MPSKEFQRGVEDKKKGNYNPPDGKGWPNSLHSAFFGSSKAQKEYITGLSHKERRKQK